MSRTMWQALRALVDLHAVSERIGPLQKYPAYAGWNRTRITTIRALVWRDLVEPCDEHVALFWPWDGTRYLADKRVRCFYRPTSRGRELVKAAAWPTCAEGAR